MESNVDNETIDSKYIITKRKGYGATGDVYLVKDTETNIEYAAKVFVSGYSCFNNEVAILNLLKEDKIVRQYIANIFSSSEGLVITKYFPPAKKKYIILDYISKGDLVDYIHQPHRGFRELHSKYIFSKILEAIENIHKAGICHRDLKLSNILVDNNFDFKICDFGFGTKNDHLLEEYLGTENHAAPEMFRKKPYNGFKADIYRQIWI